MANSTTNVTVFRFDTTASTFPNKPYWAPYPVFLTVLVPLSIVVNSFVLVIFLTTRSLRTTFSVYIIHLLIPDLLSGIVFSFDVVNTVSPRWYLGEQACTLYLYLAFLINGWTLSAHALLGINRLWAVFFPIHYRQHQTRSFKMAVYLCVATFLYLNIIVVPGIVRGALYFRLPLDKFPCRNNAPAQPEWAMAVQVLVYFLPWVFSTVTLPLIWYKRSRRNVNRVTGRSNVETDPSTRVSTIARAHKEQSFFKVWLVLTISTLVLWAPLLLYYALDLSSGKFLRTLFQAGRALFSLTVVTDPILFTVMMPEIRMRIRTWFCGCSVIKRRGDLMQPSG